MTAALCRLAGFHGISLVDTILDGRPGNLKMVLPDAYVHQPLPEREALRNFDTGCEHDEVFDRAARGL